MNYRLSGLGFLASEEDKPARVGNLRMEDRMYFFSLMFVFRLTLYRNIRETGFEVDSKVFRPVRRRPQKGYDVNASILGA